MNPFAYLLYSVMITLSFIQIAPSQDDNERFDLSTIASADMRRVQEGQNIHVFITLNLTIPNNPATALDESKYVTDFYIPVEDAKMIASGTTAERNAIRKRYIRRAIRNYTQTLQIAIPPAEVKDLGTQNVGKAQFQEAGDK